MPKNRGKKSLQARGPTALNKYRGSGFEDGYADPPMTPAEYATEKQIYDPSRPFAERIEECIQRFTARRRMTNDRINLFTKYLALGGIDTSQRQFTGTAEHVQHMTESGYDADDIRIMTSNQVLHHGWEEVGRFYNPNYPEHWDVDFAGVVAGFLGDWLPKAAGLWSPDIQLAIDIILNFLRYVRHHDVCPEYAENLAEACGICERARTEIPKTGALGAAMPGDFNLACRILFCGTGKTLSEPLGASTPADSVLYEEKVLGNCVQQRLAWDTVIIAPRGFDADRVFKATVAIQQPRLIDRVLRGGEDPVRLASTYEDAFRVAEVVFADDKAVTAYAGIRDKAGATGTVRPVGHAVLIPTIVEDGWDNHPTLADAPRGQPRNPVTIYFEHPVLACMGEGMTLRLSMAVLNVGLEFVRECTEVLPSFHVFLPQSLMLTYKPPRPKEGACPSVDDPDAEEPAVLEDLEPDKIDMIKLERQADS